MNDFKECYRSAVNDMLSTNEFHIDASQCMDERRHNRFVVRRMKRTMTTAFSAACVIFLCGFGTAKAAEYIENVIKVNQWGFESADAATMARNEAEKTEAHIISEEIGLEAEDGGNSPEIARIQNEPGADMQAALPGEEDLRGEIPPMQESSVEDKASQKIGQPEDMQENPMQKGGKEVAMSMTEAGTSGGVEEGTDAPEKEMAQDIEEIPVKNYTSWKEFEENEDIIFPQPSIIVAKAAGNVDITICGDWAMARYDMDGKVIWVERTDYAQTQGHASSKVFPGGVCNERTYTTAQGHTYTLVDSVKGSEEEELQIHGAVSVGTYEAYIDLMGYTEAEAKEIIESIDLREYE